MKWKCSLVLSILFAFIISNFVFAVQEDDTFQVDVGQEDDTGQIDIGQEDDTGQIDIGQEDDTVQYDVSEIVLKLVEIQEFLAIGFGFFIGFLVAYVFLRFVFTER